MKVFSPFSITELCLSGPLSPTKLCCAPSSKIFVWSVEALTTAQFSCVATKRMAWRTFLCKSRERVATRVPNGSSWTGVLQRSRRKEGYWLNIYVNGNTRVFILLATKTASSTYSLFQNKGKKLNISACKCVCMWAHRPSSKCVTSEVCMFLI